MHHLFEAFVWEEKCFKICLISFVWEALFKKKSASSLQRTDSPCTSQAQPVETAMLVSLHLHCTLEEHCFWLHCTFWSTLLLVYCTFRSTHNACSIAPLKNTVAAAMLVSSHVILKHSVVTTVLVSLPSFLKTLSLQQCWFHCTFFFGAHCCCSNAGVIARHSRNSLSLQQCWFHCTFQQLQCCKSAL
jgi:hypothetical protein